MKKIIITLLLSCLALSGFAVHQYDVNSDGIVFNENMSLMIHVTNNDFFKSLDSFGYYVKDGNGGYTRYGVFEVDAAQGKKFDFGNFAAGEEIGFFIGKDNDYTTLFTLTQHSNAQYSLDALGDEKSLNGNFRIQLRPGEYTGPAGQPLPGVVATVLLGGAGAGFFGLRKKWKRS
mgnify:CR=1 FL=1